MNSNDKIEIVLWVAILAIMLVFIAIAGLASRLNIVETQISKIEKIGGLSDSKKI